MLTAIREIVAEQIEFRELLYQLTLRDLLLRYKQTAMGAAWAVFMPLVNTAVFSVIFTRVAPIDTGMPYPLFAFCGLLCWNFSAASFRFAVASLTSNANLVTKVYFPREMFPISAVLVSLVDFAVGSVVLVLLMIYYRVPPTFALLALPVVIVVHTLFTIAVSLILSMANLFYRDVKYVFELLLTVWMFLSPVVYPARIGGITGRVLRLNPMAPIIEAYRDVLLRGHQPDPYALVPAAVFSVAIAVAAWLIFHRAEFRFAEYI